jgi:hypothetical protein
MERGTVASAVASVPGPTHGPLLGLMLAALCGGCVADGQDGGLLLLKNVHPDSECVATSMEDEVSVTSGTLDLLRPSGYLFIAQMKSRITALTGQEDQRTIIASGAKIDITFPGSDLFSADDLASFKASALTHMKQPFSAPVKPNGGVTDAGFDLIPAALTEQIAIKANGVDVDGVRVRVPTCMSGKLNPAIKPVQLSALATFTIEGDMAGQSVTSQTFSFPVTLGTGVSVHVAGSCPLGKDFGTPSPGYVCNPSQDGIIDCCCDGDTLTCPAKVSNM